MVSRRTRVSNDAADDDAVIDWLLRGDVAIQYQTWRDLLDQDRPELRARIAAEGWGARFMCLRRPDGIWGEGFYQPKWASSHYTLLDLMHLAIEPSNNLIRQSVHLIACNEKRPDGGVGPGKTPPVSDVCVNGMFLGYASYFGEPQSSLASVVDFILRRRERDGGFNCESNRREVRHSSLHSTLSVLEGIAAYRRSGYRYRLGELEEAAATASDFILRHRLFRSDRNGEVIHPDFLKLSYPPRWKYNILRALDHFRNAGFPYDGRMRDALEVLSGKRRADGRWPLQAAHPGAVHFRMEEGRGPSRWNTLLALRVLRRYPVA